MALGLRFETRRYAPAPTKLATIAVVQLFGSDSEVVVPSTVGVLVGTTTASGEGMTLGLGVGIGVLVVLGLALRVGTTVGLGVGFGVEIGPLH